MIVDCAVYENGLRRSGDLPLERALEAGRRQDAFVWIGLHEPTSDEFDAVAREFELHELAVEDAVNAHQRPKLEVYEGTVLLVLKTATYDDERETIDVGELLLFVGDGFLVSVRHGEASPLAEVRAAVERRDDLLRCGPAAVVHAIVDRVVDDYFVVAEGLDEDIRQVEEEVFSDVHRTNPAERIYRLTREVLGFQRIARPLVDPLDGLARGRHAFVAEGVREYFRDVHDHLLRIVDQIDAFQNLLAGALDANLAQVSVRQNEDMRKISAWVAIVAVPTMIAGIYGMNFEHMPELRWRFGYPLVVLLMVSICTLLYRRFKRAGWL